MTRFFRWLIRLLYALFIGWLVGLVRLLDECASQRRHKDRLRNEGKNTTPCQVIPPHIYKRPDPLIYCQSYLQALGLGVTWDNPDIQIYSIGPGSMRTPISSNDLEIDTLYEVRATIYNGSNEAPAVGMPVDFSFLSFGIGTVAHPIGTVPVNLPVNGAPGHPAVAIHNWLTPKEKGHYCLQVKLNWGDDANPNNNLGQENTNVGVAHSPAIFEFPVRNANVVLATIHLEADAYSLLQTITCDEVKQREAFDRESEDDRKDARRAWCAQLAQRHNGKDFPVPKGWQVDITPNGFDLQPEATQNVTVVITPPDTFHGVQAINVNAFDANALLLGGVTLYTQR